jgi:tRNA threonylcarbamoyladenosine biosynthesis protein TsaE
LQELEGLAQLLANSLTGQEVILCKGDLGAGKTSLAKLLFKKLGVSEDVTSPTFNIHIEYQARFGLCSHFDLYRIESSIEIDELGLFELIGENLLFIEWPEMVEAEIPNVDFLIEIRHNKSNQREINIRTNKWSFSDYQIGKTKLTRFEI